jgi:hypothetical protein
MLTSEEEYHFTKLVLYGFSPVKIARLWYLARGGDPSRITANAIEAEHVKLCGTYGFETLEDAVNFVSRYYDKLRADG